MATTDGRRARGNERRDQVLQAAIPLATIEGLEGFSLERLATTSGVPKGSIQILFGNKNGLQRSIILAARRTVREQILLPASRAEPGIGRLLRFGERWVEYMAAAEAGCFFCSSWTGLQSRPGPLRDLVAEDHQGWLAGLAAAIEHGVDAGQFTSVTSPSDEAVVLLGIGMAANNELRFAPEATTIERAHDLWVNQVERLR